MKLDAVEHDSLKKDQASLSMNLFCLDEVVKKLSCLE